MEDIVAIRVVDSRSKKHFFVTWGRVFDSVDPTLLLEAVRSALSKFGGISAIRSTNVCDTLQEASKQPYFYEALFSFSRERVLSERVRRSRIIAGKDIYYLGKPVA
jgi:hypothetical protein